MPRLPAALLAAFALASTNLAAQAQSPGGVDGTVKDALGRPLAGATVRLETADGRIAGSAAVGPDGRFALSGVAAGTYAVIGQQSGFDSATAIVTVPAGGAAHAELALPARTALTVDVQARRLDEARNGISPRVGAAVYDISREAIQREPQGENTPFNQVLLQAPGVAQDSFGQVHLRGEHANVQYRINGVLLPEGISGFGQTLESRFGQHVQLITGALPAQYGYRTSGVVEIDTKSGAFDQGGQVSLYGGGNETIQPSVEYGGSVGSFNYYFSGEYLGTSRGIESPTNAKTPLRDQAEEPKGFFYVSKLLDATTRVSLFGGTSVGTFQIPNNPGQPTAFTLNGNAAFDSAKLDERQREINHYAVAALQQSQGGLDYQVAAFTRYSSILFRPDPVGDLLFNGVASRVARVNLASGIQADGGYRLTDAHTVRGGLFVDVERALSRNDATVFAVDDSGNQLSDQPVLVTDAHAKTGRLYGLYLQDEWRITPAFTVNVGARYDAVNAFVSADQLSPRINASYKVLKGTTVHAGYARYFTPPPLELINPGSAALFLGTTNAPQTLANGQVKPERAHYIDAGVTQRLTDAVQVGFDSYYKIVDDLLDEGQFGQALVFTPFNYKRGRIYGAEATASYQQDNLQAYLNLAYSVAKGRQIESAQFLFGADELAYIATHDVHLDHDQRWTMSGGVSYLWQGATVSVTGLLGSGLRRGFANTQSLPPYTQVNLGAVYPFETAAFGKMAVRADVLNVFDSRYEIRDGTGIGVGAPQWGVRRTLLAGLSKAF